MTVLLLDIDHVILTWDDTHSSPYNGFDDYVHPHKAYFSRYSPEQLQLIHEYFPDIYWHTTWSLSNSANTVFCPTTGFCIRDNLVDKYQGNIRHLPPEVRAACGMASWFKLDAVAFWLESGATDRFVWADDDLANTWRRGVKTVLDYYGATDRCLAIVPEDGWTREGIEFAREWDTYGDPGVYHVDHSYRG